jgi:hypothetical protein
MGDRRPPTRGKSSRNHVRTRASKDIAVGELRRDGLGRPGRRRGDRCAGKREALAVNLAAAGIENRHDRDRAGERASTGGMDFERADADDRTADDQSEPAGGGDADPHPGERSGADSYRDAIEIGKVEPRLDHGRIDHAEQTLGMATPDILGEHHRLPTIADNGDRARFERGIDCK